MLHSEDLAAAVAVAEAVVVAVDTAAAVVDEEAAMPAVQLEAWVRSLGVVVDGAGRVGIDFAVEEEERTGSAFVEVAGRIVDVEAVAGSPAASLEVVAAVVEVEVEVVLVVLAVVGGESRPRLDQQVQGG